LSEEPPDDKSPAIQRRRNENKRKLEERSSMLEAEVLLKKHEKQELDELMIPPPPVDVPIPEPMETLENQVYERPRDRKNRIEENGNIVNLDRTPKVRRKQKSLGDINAEKHASPVQEQIFYDALQEQPNSLSGIEQRLIEEKLVLKDTKESLEVPFERPEPMTSPRPPRSVRTISPPTEPMEKNLINIPETNCQDTDSNVLKTIPPPLPEKKSKTTGTAKHPVLDKNVDIEKGSTDLHERLRSPCVPVKDEVIKDQCADVENITEKTGASEIKNASPLLMETVLDTACTQQQLCDQRSDIILIKDIIMPTCDHASVQTVHSPTVISSVDVCHVDNSSIETNLSNVSASKGPYLNRNISSSQAVELMQSTAEIDVAKGQESYPQKKLLPPPSILSSVQPQIGNITLETIAVVEEGVPELKEFVSEMQRNSEPAFVEKEEISSSYPIVKPFPLQIPSKNCNEKGDKEVIVVRPPWVKPQQSETDSVDSRKTKETVQPSINNLPKLVQNKSADHEDQATQCPVVKQEQARLSINNLPKLKIDLKLDTSESPPNHQEKILILSPDPALPLVVPFPGLNKEVGTVVSPHSQLVKQDSPKSLINNIPKPFKTETERFVVQEIPTNQITPTYPEDSKVLLSSMALSPVASHSAKASKSSDSVGSCISLSDDELHKPNQNTPFILPKPNGPNINYSTLSPSSSGSNIDSSKKNSDKRDSKVIKAAAYWNNYIGEVTSKSKPPSNPKAYEKPKKIVSAGIGERGLKELTSAFEQGKPIQPEDKFTILRRNSKKMSIESCNPGLRVNDAKSVFEKKFQPIETPRLVRRASSSLEKPKWGSSAQGQETSEVSNGQVSSSSPSEFSECTDSSHSPKNKSENIVCQDKTKPSGSKSDKPISPALERKKHEKVLKAKSPLQDKATIQRNHQDMTENGKSLNSENVKILKTTVAATSLMDQPKPPTSPKPKVRKEDLKIKEDLAKNKEGVPQLTKKNVDNSLFVAPLPTTEKQHGETALIKKLKEFDKCTESSGIKTETLESSNGIAKIKVETRQSEGNTEINVSEMQATQSKVGNETNMEAKLVNIEEKGSLGINEDKFAKSLQEDYNVDDKAKKDNRDLKHDIPLAKESEVPKMLIGSKKIKSPEPDKSEQIRSPEPNLSELRNALKKVPHSAVSRRKSCNENETMHLELLQLPSEKKISGKEPLSGCIPEVQPSLHVQENSRSIDLSSKTHEGDSGTPKERIIPIQLVNENRNQGPKPFKLEVENSFYTPLRKQEEPARKPEHNIPIMVEGADSASRKGKTPEEESEKTEQLDNFNSSSMSRRRWGSRKKRMSSAFSDSSISDDDALSTPFGGLQKYSSYGKHGLEEPPLSRLKKTRPPFSVEKTDSFSSGEDDFDDDGFQEMTAENLFSTLLSRVKSLTRRIHDEHDEHLNWQRSRHGPPKLNPGGTHARLERTAQRNSIKRTGDMTPSFSRQSSSYDEAPSQKNYNDSSSLLRSYNSSFTPTRIYNRSTSSNADSDSRYSTGSRYSTSTTKRYDEVDAASDFSSSISVTSSQRLRPGYLPPPANHNPLYASDPNTFKPNDVDAQLTAQHITSKAQESSERNIPINVQKHTLDSPSHSKPGTPLPMPGVYIKHMKPFSSSHANGSNNRLESPEPLNDGGDRQRRVSRFLRPDFYDIPKEDSIYAKMKELEDEDKKKPRFLRVVHPRTRDSTSGRSTPLDFLSYSEDGIKTDSPNIQHDLAAPVSEGQCLPRTFIPKCPVSSNEPPTQFAVANTINSQSHNQNQCFPTPCIVHSPETALPTVKTSIQKFRRVIYPYTGAKSDGQLLNKHANVSLNIIAAAERKKRQSYFQQADADPSQEKVMASSSSFLSCTNIPFDGLFCIKR
jgi:hypothetical protein